MLDYTQLLQRFETDQVVAFLGSEDMAALMNDPRVLAGLALFAVIALFMKWRALLALVLCVSGFSWLISYTLQHDTNLASMSNDSLLIFVVGGVATVFIVIYLLFIKTD